MSTTSIPGVYNIIIYDFAYNLLPDLSGPGSPSDTNFTGVIIHELAHVAMIQNPFIEESYSMRSNWLYYPDTLLPRTFGFAYNFSSSDNDNCEIIAMAASTWQLNVLSFDSSVLFLSYTDWRKDWIELFYSPNPLVMENYDGPATWEAAP